MKTPKFKRSNITITGELNINFAGGPIGVGIEIQIQGNKAGNVGVYCLRNKFNGRLYIGKARNLNTRYQRHCRDIENGTHHSKSLIQDFKEGVDKLMLEDDNNVYFPSDVFEFEVIIFCRESELTFYENYLIKYLNPYYNIHKQREILLDFDVMSEDNL